MGLCVLSCVAEAVELFWRENRKDICIQSLALQFVVILLNSALSCNLVQRMFLVLCSIQHC